MVAGRHDFIIERGTDVVIPIALTDENDVAIDITGYSITFTLEDTSGNVLLTLDTDANGGVTITNAAAGQFSVTITNAQTSALDAGKYIYSIVFAIPDASLPDGVRNEAAMRGIVEVDDIAGV